VQQVGDHRCLLIRRVVDLRRMSRKDYCCQQRSRSETDTTAYSARRTDSYSYLFVMDASERDLFTGELSVLILNVLYSMLSVES
jgi:hypothetical protein